MEIGEPPNVKAFLEYISEQGIVLSISHKSYCSGPLSAQTNKSEQEKQGKQNGGDKMEATEDTVNLTTEDIMRLSTVRSDSNSL